MSGRRTRVSRIPIFHSTPRLTMTESWDSGLTVLSPPYYSCPFASSDIFVMVPLSLVFIAKKSQTIHTEFMFYATADSDNTMIIVRDDYCVPRQTASLAYVEATPGECKGYNVVIHKHPDGVSSFSSIDDESINANNDVSILLENGKIAEISIKKKLPCGHYAAVRVPRENIVIYGDINKIGDAEKRADEVLKTIREKLNNSNYYL